MRSQAVVVIQKFVVVYRDKSERTNIKPSLQRAFEI